MYIAQYVHRRMQAGECDRPVELGQRSLCSVAEPETQNDDPGKQQSEYNRDELQQS